MAVISVQETWQGRDGTFENILDNTVTRTFLVKTNNKFDDQFVIVNYFSGTLGISFLTPHPSNGFYTARRLSAVQKAETPFAWDVSVDYSTAPLSENEQDQDFENPLQRPTIITWGSEFVRRFTTEDKDGEPIWNTAADPYEPQEVDHTRWRISFRKNLATVPAWVTGFVNKVNSASVQIQGVTLAPRTLKLSGLAISELKVQNEIPYFEVSAEMSYDPETWDLRLLSAGLRESAGNPVLDEDGDPVASPWPLDEDGGKIESPTAENVVWQTFKVYKEADFNQLPL